MALAREATDSRCRAPPPRVAQQACGKLATAPVPSMTPTDKPAPSTQTEHDALPPGTRFGEFEIVRVIGIGGFGIVYLARDHSLERDVALKEYMPASLAARGAGPQITVRSTAFAETYAIGLRSFVNEARLLARFDHPSLVKVYRFWEDNQTAYMVMQYVQGITLRDTRRAMPQSPDEVWIRRVIDPIIGALALLHREGVYHRDIAPDNILLPPEGAPVLLDFGAARRVISDRTQSLTAILKPSYAPIEQYAEMPHLRQGPWTDIYALGAVVHYLLFGQPPLPATARALQEDGDPIAGRQVAGVTPAFLQAVGWALAVRPSDRPQSIDELRGALDGRVAIPALGPQTITLPGSLAPAAGGPGGAADPATVHADARLPPTMPRQSPAPTTPPPRTAPPRPPAPPDPAAEQTVLRPAAPVGPSAVGSTLSPSARDAPRSAPSVSAPPASAPPSPAPRTAATSPVGSPPRTGVPAGTSSPAIGAAREASVPRPQLSPRPAAPVPSPAPRRNGPAIALIAGLVLIVVVLASWLVLGGRKSAPAQAGAETAPSASAPALADAASQATAPSASAAATGTTADSASGSMTTPPIAEAPPAPSGAAQGDMNPVSAGGSPLAAVLPASGADRRASATAASAPASAARIAAASSAASGARGRSTTGARADGALRPAPGADHNDYSSSTQGGGVPQATREAPPAESAYAGPASAREACQGRAFLAFAVCMERECDTTRFRNTAECVPILDRKRARESR